MNRREFFRMIFGAGAACVLPKITPEVTERDIAEKLTELQGTQKLTWATEQIAINPMTDEQLEWLRKKFAESDCVGEVRIVPKCDSRVDWESDGYTWQRYMEQVIADEMTLPHPGINDIFIDN